MKSIALNVKLLYMMFVYQVVTLLLMCLGLVCLCVCVLLAYAASGGLSDVNRDYQKEPLTQSELERQQILQEMKKKTSLNTDNSWIRQQSTASVPVKEPIDLPMRRSESELCFLRL